MQVQPYLFFAGRCDEAVEFYSRALGAEVTALMRFDESPDAVPPEAIPPGWGRKVMHGSLRIGEATVMISDGITAEPGFQGFSLAIVVDDVAAAERAFAALADGGEVQMPFAKTFWSPGYGMVTDRFGVPWQVNTAAEAAS
jgi:PhnB protein